MEENLLKDLKRIEVVICGTDRISSEELQIELVAKYRGEIDHIESDLDDGFVDINGNVNDRKPDYIRNLKTIRGKLQILLAKIKDEKKKPRVQLSSSPLISNTTYNNSSSDNNANNTLSNANTNENSNTINVELLFEEAKKQIEDNDSLSEEDISEILGKIEDLESLCKSDEKPRTKWSKAKEIMTWLFDKGAKVATIVLPLITEAIK